MQSYFVRHHSTTTRHAFITRVTAASQGCGRKRTRSSARRTALPLKIMWAQPYISDNYVVFSVTSFNSRPDGVHRLSFLVQPLNMRWHSYCLLVWRVATGRTVTRSAHPSFWTRVPRLPQEQRGRGVMLSTHPNLVSVCVTRTALSYRKWWVDSEIQNTQIYYITANGMRTRDNRHNSSNGARQLHVIPELFCKRRIWF